jgi:hypothetical protein
MSVLSRRAVLGWMVGTAGAAVVRAADPPADPLRAADPLGLMLADARAGYARLRDYACTFTRQERVNGVMAPEQVAVMKVRVQPFCVHVRFARPEGIAGAEACFRADRPDGKVKVRVAGPKGVNGFVPVSATDPRAALDGRLALPELGVGKVIEVLTAVVGREKTLGNPVEVTTADYQFAGRPVTRYEVFTRRPHAARYAYRCVVCVDKEWKLPVRFEAYDQPRPGAAIDGELALAHSYSDLKPNVGLGDSSFNY